MENPGILEDVSRWLEGYAYCSTLDLSEYDEATGKMKDVLAAFKMTDAQDPWKWTRS
jgi:hypothetical protein